MGEIKRPEIEKLKQKEITITKTGKKLKRRKNRKAVRISIIHEISPERHKMSMVGTISEKKFLIKWANIYVTNDTQIRERSIFLYLHRHLAPLSDWFHGYLHLLTFFSRCSFFSSLVSAFNPNRDYDLKYWNIFFKVNQIITPTSQWHHNKGGIGHSIT